MAIAEMIPPLAPSGDLPRGRYAAGLDEIQDRFVSDSSLASSTRRPKIWTDWQEATMLLRGIVPVQSMWVGGSFTSNKLEPDDVDCVYWVDEQLLADALTDPAARNLLSHFNRNDLQAAGYWVDVYVLTWRENRDISTPQLAEDYYRSRGYWDDLWLRKRSGVKGAPSVRQDTFPTRGYLEVEVDGWS